jgi:heme exporter protein A
MNVTAPDWTTPPAPFAARNLTCIRGDRLVFSDLSFALEPGRALLLHGPNGTGKSSLLRLLAGLLPSAAGELLWANAPVRPAQEEHRARLHYVGHLDAVKPALTVRENLAFWAGMAGQAARVDAALAIFGLGHLADIPGRFLSAGQKRRLNLARLAAIPAPLWLLDEPSVSLDIEAVALLAGLIAAHGRQGGLVIAASHVDFGLTGAAQLDLGTYTTAMAT